MLLSKRVANSACWHAVHARGASRALSPVSRTHIHARAHAQGFAIAVKTKCTKEQVDSVVGIHPSTAEEFVTMRRCACAWRAGPFAPLCSHTTRCCNGRERLKALSQRSIHTEPCGQPRPRALPMLCSLLALAAACHGRSGAAKL